MSNFIQQIQEFFAPAFNVMSSFRLSDLLDIIIVAFLIYKAIQLIRQTRAEQLLKGIFVLIIGYGLSYLLELHILSFILDRILEFGVVAIVILFQPELRRALEQVGRSKIGQLGFGSNAVQSELVWLPTINAVCRAVNTLQNEKTGALIVIERNTRLGEMINTGTVLDADATYDLLCNIFYPKAPLHDGAVIIRNGKIYAAGCILPLTQKADIFRDLGTRHRAAIGISENSDAVVVIVSEETGIISVALNGELTRSYNMASLHVLLEQELVKSGDDESLIKKGKLFFKNKSKKGRNENE